MKQVLAVAAGGAVGSVARHLTGKIVVSVMDRPSHLATLSVNVIGSFLVGLVYVLLAERLGASHVWRSLFIVGLLGGYTTFSAFSIETFLLLEQGLIAKALLNVFMNVALCLVATWTGVVLARMLP